jgi:hypothetical protein
MTTATTNLKRALVTLAARGEHPRRTPTLRRTPQHRPGFIYSPRVF